jgi:hypothetical protein
MSSKRQLLPSKSWWFLRFCHPSSHFFSGIKVQIHSLSLSLLSFIMSASSFNLLYVSIQCAFLFSFLLAALFSICCSILALNAFLNSSWWSLRSFAISWASLLNVSRPFQDHPQSRTLIFWWRWIDWSACWEAFVNLGDWQRQSC